MKQEKYVSKQGYWRGRDSEKGVIVKNMKADKKAADDLNRAGIAGTTTPASRVKTKSAPPQTNESQLRYAIQEALKRKFSPLKEAEEMSSALLYQVVLVLSVSKPIRDIAGKLNRIP